MHDYDFYEDYARQRSEKQFEQAIKHMDRALDPNDPSDASSNTLWTLGNQLVRATYVAEQSRLLHKQVALREKQKAEGLQRRLAACACRHCGHVHRNNLDGDRVRCVVCGHTVDREENTRLNLAWLEQHGHTTDLEPDLLQFPQVDGFVPQFDTYWR